MTQLTLALQPRRTPARQLPAIERLRAVLTRQGIDWRYRATRNSILFRPMFGPHFGWQPMCGRYGCQDITFERVDYRELEPAADRDDRDARLAFLAVRREQIHELWGRPRADEPDPAPPPCRPSTSPWCRWATTTPTPKARPAPTAARA